MKDKEFYKAGDILVHIRTGNKYEVTWVHTSDTSGTSGSSGTIYLLGGLGLYGCEDVSKQFYNKAEIRRLKLERILL